MKSVWIAGVRRRAGEMVHQKQGRAIRPMDVLDHQQDRLPPGDAHQQVGYRTVKPVPLGVRVPGERGGELADPLREVG